MATSAPEQVPFRILAAHQGLPSKPVEYRVRVGSSVKYLIATTKRLPTIPDTNGDYLGFDTLPMGDWDVANLIPGSDGKYAIASTEKKRFPDVTPIWHPTKIDLLELKDLEFEKLRQHDLEFGEPESDEEDDWLDDNPQLAVHVPSAIYPGPKSLASENVIARWTWGLDNTEQYYWLLWDCSFYSLLKDDPITPRFLGHLTDNQERVIGYIVESVSSREAGIQDLGRCRDALRKFHGLGFAHGCISKHSFLIRDDIHTVQLQNFFASYKTTDQAIFDKEIASIEEALRKPPEPKASAESIAEVNVIWRRDGYVHPFIWWQLKQDGRISVSEDEHRAFLDELDKRTRPWSTKDSEELAERRKGLQLSGGHEESATGGATLLPALQETGGPSGV